MKLNTKQKTKDGKILFPFTIKGDMVYCYDKNNKTIIKKITDFIIDEEKEEKTIKIVVPILEPDDQLFEEEEKTTELFENPIGEVVKKEEIKNIWDTIDNGGYI